MQEGETRSLTKEEMEALTKDLQDVLTKHGAEMGVVSTINLMKSSIPSPYVTNNGEETKKEEGSEANSEATSGSEGGSTEPTQS